MGEDERQLNVSDALGYLDAVKQVFSTRTEVYNIFLDIMKDFKSNLIDTPGVIDRITELFKGHAVLIHGFNTFLPNGYRIDVTGAHTIRITTPKGESTRDTNTNTEHTDMDLAMQYVKTVKARYATQPDTYRAFLEILWSHTKGGSEAEQAAVSARVDALFADAPDLARAFREFIPGAGAASTPLSPTDATATRRIMALQGDSIGKRSTQYDADLAVQYMMTVKARYMHKPDTYHAFLEILSSHIFNGSEEGLATLVARIDALFVDTPDLARAFRAFVPSFALSAPPRTLSNHN